jgi:leader peptidase (prepilin peptidase)/N-methyltransferase
VTAAVTVLAGLLGLLIGSFLNVVIWRVPRGESVVSPPSACPGCGRRITPRDNVPVLSWLLLRGRCRGCREPISLRYPLVELGTGVLFAAVAWRVGLSAALPAFLYLAAVAVALALIDLDVRRLPDAIVLPSIPVAVVLLALASWGTGDWGAVARGAIGGVALLVFYFLPNLVRPGAMGLGDVKLAGLLGLYLAWVGWGELVVGAFAAFLFGGLVSIPLVLARRAGRGSKIPFGPFMLLGAGFGLAAGGAVASAYVTAVL